MQLHGVSRRRPYASGRSTSVPVASSTCPLSWRWPRPKSTNTQLYSGHSCASVGSLSAPQRPVPSGRPVASPVAARLSGALAPWLGSGLGLALGLGLGLLTLTLTLTLALTLTLTLALTLSPSP